MRIFTTVSLLLIVSKLVCGQSFSSENLKPELKARASAVVRLEATEVFIEDLNEINLNIKKIITVLNENGDEDAGLVIGYDKLNHIQSIKGVIYNEFGIPIGKFSEKDFTDESAVSSFSLFEDSRIKSFTPSSRNYPYTIEYNYQLRLRQSLVLPDWRPVNSTGVSVERSTLRVVAKPDVKLRYKQFNIGEPIQDLDKAGNKQYTWKVSGLKAIRLEPFGPHPEDFLPSVKLSLVNFQYHNVRGSFSNWKEYGQWMNEELLKGRDVISPETTDYIANLVKDIKDPKLKAKRIYEYIQEKTRYISVQIGIGGYQPMLASDVERLGYGDCKGLVNFTQALLKIAGIESYYTIVEAGNSKRDAIPDFASMNQFNHVILCMPFANDTTWVDCTSKTLPFGYLGDFTDDRLVLACTRDGGQLLRTPKYPSESNVQSRKGSFVIDSGGDLHGETLTTFQGLQYDKREFLVKEPLAEKIKMLKEIYPIDMEVLSYNLSQEKDADPVTSENFKFKGRKYATLNGSRLYIPLNIMNAISAVPKEIANRSTDVIINRGFLEIDTITIKLPAGYILDTRPKDISIEKPFGTFTSSLIIKNGEVLFRRRFHLKDGTFPSSQYADLVDFFNSILASDNNRITLIKG